MVLYEMEFNRKVSKIDRIMGYGLLIDRKKKLHRPPSSGSVHHLGFYAQIYGFLIVRIPRWTTTSATSYDPNHPGFKTIFLSRINIIYDFTTITHQ